MKKGQAWLNTFTPAVSYLLRCNHDVTSLLSGTAIKSVIAYVADYITKTPLKTHVMFQAVQQVFEGKTELIGSVETKKDKARSLITKIVNALTAASETWLEVGHFWQIRLMRLEFEMYSNNNDRAVV